MQAIEFFTVKMNLNSSGAQPLLMSILQSDGGEVMQTSDGLVIKTTKTLDQVKEMLAAKDLADSLTVEPLDMAMEQEFAPDLRKFIEDCAH